MGAGGRSWSEKDEAMRGRWGSMITCGPGGIVLQLKQRARKHAGARTGQGIEGGSRILRFRIYLNDEFTDPSSLVGQGSMTAGEMALCSLPMVYFVFV